CFTRLLGSRRAPTVAAYGIKLATGFMKTKSDVLSSPDQNTAAKFQPTSKRRNGNGIQSLVHHGRIEGLRHGAHKGSLRCGRHSCRNRSKSEDDRGCLWQTRSPAYIEAGRHERAAGQGCCERSAEAVRSNRCPGQ